MTYKQKQELEEIEARAAAYQQRLEAMLPGLGPIFADVWAAVSVAWDEDISPSIESALDRLYALVEPRSEAAPSNVIDLGPYLAARRAADEDDD